MQIGVIKELLALLVETPPTEVAKLAALVPGRFANRRGPFFPVNIAEGFRWRSQADKARFLNLAEGSVEECRYFLLFAQDLGYGNAQKPSALLEQVSRLLNAYAAAILTSGL